MAPQEPTSTQRKDNKSILPLETQGTLIEYKLKPDRQPETANLYEIKPQKKNLLDNSQF